MLRLIAWLLLAALSLPLLARDPDSTAILLVARKDLPDPFFRDSVVLVTNASVAPVGVIINKPLDLPLSKALPEGDPLKSRTDKVFFGGPVKSDELLFVFRAEKAPENALRVMEEIYLSGSRELLTALLARETPREALRLYVGHAGWAPGQLEAEIARGDWALLPADAAAIFTAKPESLWPELRRRAGATKVRLSLP